MPASFEGRTSRYTCLTLPARRSIDFRAMASPIPILLQSVATAIDAMWPRPLRTSEIRYPATLPSLRATMNPSPTLSLNHAKMIRGYGSGNEAFSIAIIWSRSSHSKVPSLRSLNPVRSTSPPTPTSQHSFPRRDGSALSQARGLDRRHASGHAQDDCLSRELFAPRRFDLLQRVLPASLFH